MPTATFTFNYTYAYRFFIGGGDGLAEEPGRQR